MITVSDAWKDIQQRFLLPETYIEIDCGITDGEAQSVAEASGTDETIFSNASSVVDNLADIAKYATLEQNLWSLDGTQAILPSSGAYENSGYVSDIESTGSVTLTFPAIRTTAISGVTITWSENYGEYAKTFSVIGKNGSDIISEVTVTDNKSNVSVVYLPLENYDGIVVMVHEWGLPNRRVRIEKIVIGHTLKFSKDDLFSYTHEQDGDLLSGQIPKYSIDFTLDNSDGRWDPNNPSGMARYLSERQKLTVKYGLDVNGVVEWIKAGTFYLSEWSAPPNGIEARFIARDIFEFLLNEKYTLNKGGTISSDSPTLEQVLIDIFASAELPDNFEYALNGSMLPYYVPSINAETEYTCAEIIQLCANMGCCYIDYDRDGKLYINDFVRPSSKEEIEYIVPISLSYAHPEVVLSKPLKSVSVDYGDDTYVLEVGTTGETQTVSNPILKDLLYAEDMANWVKYILESRKTVSGEYRADPRLDVYDVVVVESKYGELSPVLITNIKYTFNGSFRGTYTGKIVSFSEVG